jgi:hypothetical protein
MFCLGKKLRVYCGSPSYAAPEIIACTEYEGPPVVSFRSVAFNPDETPAPDLMKFLYT